MASFDPTLGDQLLSKAAVCTQVRAQQRLGAFDGASNWNEVDLAGLRDLDLDVVAIARMGAGITTRPPVLTRALPLGNMSPIDYLSQIIGRCGDPL
jgi:hypothetical protein